MLAALLFIATAATAAVAQDLCPNDINSGFGNCPHMVCYSIVCGGLAKTPADGCGAQNNQDFWTCIQCLQMQNPPNATLINLVKQEQILCLPSGQSTPAPATATYVPGQASTAIPTPSGIAGSGGGAAASSGGAAASSHAAAGASSGGAGAASPSPSAAAKPSHAGPVVGVSLAALGALFAGATMLLL